MGNFYTIRISHWLVAIAIAFLLHLIAAIQLEYESSEISTGPDARSITISLKKLTSPVPQIQPKINEAIQPTEPQHTRVPEKPKPKKQSKSEKPKPVVKTPEVQPLTSEAEPGEISETSQPPSSDIQNRKPVTHSQPDSIASEKSVKKVTDRSQIHNAYLVKLGKWLARHKHYPSIARRRKQEDTVKVRFVIDADGTLISYQILEPSEFSSLNKAVVSLLERASPMPEVPVAIRKGKSEFEYTIPIEYKLVAD
jgi:protein TonB